MIISKTAMVKVGSEHSGSLLNVSQVAVRPSHKDASMDNPSPLLRMNKDSDVFILSIGSLLS